MDKKFIKGFFTGCLTAIFAIILLVFVAIKLLMAIFPVSPSEYTDPKDYQIIKEKMVKQDEIKHFPAQIPENATEVAMYGRTDMPYNGETFLLEFKTNRPYIEKELSKYDFWNKKDKIGTKQKTRLNPEIGNINTQNYTYYVLKEPENENIYKEHFPLFNGIGINGKQNKILYYHFYPAD